MPEANAIFEGGVVIPVNTDLTGLQAGLGEVKRLTSGSPNIIKVTAQMTYDERQRVQELNKLIRASERDIARTEALKMAVSLGVRGGEYAAVAARAQAELDKRPLTLKVTPQESERSGRQLSIQAYQQTLERKAGRSGVEQESRNIVASTLAQVRSGERDAKAEAAANELLAKSYGIVSADAAAARREIEATNLQIRNGERSQVAYYQTLERRTSRGASVQADRDAEALMLRKMRGDADTASRDERVRTKLFGEPTPADIRIGPERSIQAYQQTLERRYGRSADEQRRRDAEAEMLRAARRPIPTATASADYALSGITGRDFMAKSREAGAAADKAAQAMELTAKSLQKIAKVGMAVAAAANVAEGLIDVYSADTTEKRGRAVDRAREGIRQIPVVGGTADTVGNLAYRLGSATYNYFRRGQFESDTGYAERMAEETAKQEEKTARQAQLLRTRQATEARSVSLRESVADSDAERRAVLAERQQRRLDAIDLSGGDKESQDEYKLASRANAKELAAFDREVKARRDSAEFSREAVTLDTRAIRSEMAGDAPAAFEDRQDATRSRLLAQHTTERAAAAKNADELKAVEAKQAAELLALDAQTEQQRAEFKRQRLADTANATATSAEAMLRVQERHYEADLAAFDAATKAKLDAIDDLEAKQNEATRRAAQRAVMVAEEERRAQRSTDAIRAGTDATRLRMQKRYDEAEREDFEARAEQRIADVQGKSVGEAWAVGEDIVAERQALKQQQKERRTEAMASLDTRQWVAAARGKGMDDLAGMMGQLAGMAAELRAAPADLRDMITATQQVELKSMESQILNPRRYASEWDASREAVGGPGGDKGDEMVELLRSIRDYSRQMAGQGGDYLN